MNPLPCTVVGVSMFCTVYYAQWRSLVSVVNCLSCTMVHLLLVWNLVRCTVVDIYGCVDPLPCSMAVTSVCCGRLTVHRGGPWHLWCTLLPCIMVVTVVCCRPFMPTLSLTVAICLARIIFVLTVELSHHLVIHVHSLI